MARPVETVAPSAADELMIASHDAVVRRIEAAAERFGRDAAGEDAAACARIAAFIGWMNHPGRFASPRLERALRVGAAALSQVPFEGTAGGDPRRVLHVMTEGYDTGGHTRLAWRWMEQDAGRTHALALTRHRAVPAALAEAATRGGLPVDMPGPEATLLERAQRLRALAAKFDVVLLHVHPDDPVPSMALASAAQPRPPVVYVNHADHAFWLGREAADLVVNHRHVGSRLTVERRGIPSERTALLPLPLQGATASGDRDAMRRELGIGPDQVVLLTVGSNYKFKPVGGAHFLDAAEPVLARHPEAVLIAVGPGDSGRFAQARRRSGGRVRAMGTRSEIGGFYAAADLYLESYPFSSATAVREAAAHGVPVVTFAPDPAEADIFGSDASLASVWQRAETLEEYAAIAGELITDPAARARWGEAARRSVDESVDERQWGDLLDGVYSRAFAVGPVRVEELDEPGTELDDYDKFVHRLHACSDKQIDIGQADAATRILELASRSPAVRLTFASLAGHAGVPERKLQYPVALAAPVADERVVDTTVEEFRKLAVSGIAASYRMVVQPGELEDVVPLIEAALAAGPDMDIDLAAHDDPRTAIDPGTLVVTLEGDGFGHLPEDRFPVQHRAA